MSRYDIYQSNAAEVPIMRKWIVRALIISLLIHLGLFIFFQFKKLENFRIPSTTERLAPPLRAFKQVKLPKIPDEPEETRLKLPEKVPNVAQLTVPQDKPQVEEVRLAPQVPEMPKPLLTEKPKAEATGSDLFAKVEAQSRGAMEKELNSISGSLLKDSPKSARQPAIQLPKRKPGDAGAGGAEGIPGTISIDRALEMTGPLPAGNKPIGMPGGALYEYDSADLKPEAIEQLEKLGELIKRNDKATFSIEGHTDSLGDPAYNQSLSERRASAVREWLVANMGIAAGRIQTKGFGSARPIVEPRPVDRGNPAALEAEIARQQPNRRVEIVIKTNRK